VTAGSPGASTKLTNPDTLYLPLPARKPVLVQVPPPVTSWGRPGFERNVPVPVSVIMLSHDDAAQADAFPPGSVVVFGGGPERWMMSQRIRALSLNGDKAHDFNGVSQYLTISSSAVFSIPTTDTLTWEAWVRPDVLNFPRSSTG
jgi:hypothetical protein